MTASAVLPAESLTSRGQVAADRGRTRQRKAAAGADSADGRSCIWLWAIRERVPRRCSASGRTLRMVIGSRAVDGVMWRMHPCQQTASNDVMLMRTRSPRNARMAWPGTGA
jgi:hypothetical protein